MKALIYHVPRTGGNSLVRALAGTRITGSTIGKDFNQHVGAHVTEFFGTWPAVAGHFGWGVHERIGCEGCHGALAAHAEAPDEVTVERPDPAALCLRCHAQTSYRPEDFPQVSEAEHAEGEPCDSCHEPHTPAL